MNKIEHMAVWVTDLEKMKEFYIRYFNGTANQKYVNPVRGFSSYFISFGEGPRLEIMNLQDIAPDGNSERVVRGWAHLAFSLGTRKAVEELTEKFRNEGYTVESEPRTTGDGYFESVILDPEGNQLELTI